MNITPELSDSIYRLRLALHLYALSRHSARGGVILKKTVVDLLDALAEGHTSEQVQIRYVRQLPRLVTRFQGLADNLC
jgi:hypothetical protein